MGGGWVVDYFKKPTVVLAARGIVVGVVDFFFVGNTADATGIGRHFLPGTYRVWVELYDVKSNEAEFRIVSRSSQEQAVHERINEIARSRGDHQLKVSAYRELAASHDGSVFLPNIYELLMGELSSMVDSEPAKEAALEYIDSFPNFGGIRSAVSIYERHLEVRAGVQRNSVPTADQASEITSSLESLRGKYPGTLTAHFVQVKIEKKFKEWKEGEPPDLKTPLDRE